VALGAQLVALQVFDGYGYSDVTGSNGTAGHWFAPFGTHAREGAALVLGFDSPVAFTDKTVDLMCYVQPRSAERSPVECGHGDTVGVELPPPAEFAYEYWDTAHWEPLVLEADETRAFTRDGHIRFAGPGPAVAKAVVGAVSTPLYWLRIRLVGNTYELSPRLSGLLTGTIAASQAQSTGDEVLGGSDGTPNQGPFRLANRPVLDLDTPLTLTRSDGTVVTVIGLLLEVDEGGGPEPWQQVGDLLTSGPDHPHYTCDATAGEVRFGDGRHGRIPPANPLNPTGNIVARAYRYGGGKAGNVGAGAVTTLQTFAAGVSSVTNLRPGVGGADEETVDEAKRRAPAILKARDRAVTAEDFETLALATPLVPVRRARALPLHHPAFPGIPIPGVVSVIVLPDGEGTAPVPSETTLRAVCVHLNAHRLVTNELYVVPPHYRDVQVGADIVVRPEADLAIVDRALSTRLATYFHPLRGGEDGEGWPFGGTVYYSSLCRVVLDVPGVSRIKDNQLTLELDGEAQAFCRDVPIEAGQLLRALTAQLRVSYA
jgi:predicted phage baseplate assembly protein